MNEKFHADSNAVNLPEGKNSTKGVGRSAPDPKKAVEKDKVRIPMGPGIPGNVPGAHFQFNEYIVYDETQVKIKYLLRVRFNYKSQNWM